MSKRAYKAALKAYPKEDGKVWNSAFGVFEFDRNALQREAFQEGYEQAEKDTIEGVVEWLKVHAEDYIVNMTGSYPNAPFCAIIGGRCWDELKKAMEKK